MDRVSRLLGCLLLVLGFILSCTQPIPTATSLPDPTETPTSVATATSALTPTATPASTATPSPTHTPVPTPEPTPGPLSPAEIFTQVSPSLAFIETATGTGSGILIEGGYVLTNAHVVWPFQNVRVAFPDSSEFLEAPVVNTDPLGDLAIIGPLDTPITPLELTDGEDLVIGSDLFLIGYPAEGEKFPQPTITRGILSRMREWEALGMSYFQTDAAIAGGQSGGVLVSDEGKAIGVSTFKFSEAQFGIVASAVDVRPRVIKLISGDKIDGLGPQQVPLSGGAPEDAGFLTSIWDTAVYVINTPKGSTIDLKVDGEDDLALYVLDVFGNIVVESDNGVAGIEHGSVETTVDAPHFAFVTLPVSERGRYEITSNLNLSPYTDSQDGRFIEVGETVQFSMDYPLDFDYFYLNLDEGETVNVTVESMNLDTVLQIDYDRSTGQVSDDDSGGGIFGTDSKLTFRAPSKAQYTIVVSDAERTGVGGYFLKVSVAPPDAEPFAIAPPTPVLDTPFGSMQMYESVQHPFSIERPAFWSEQAVDPAEFSAHFISDGGEQFVIAEEDFQGLGLVGASLDEYVDIVITVIEATTPGFELLSRENLRTAQGLPAQVITASVLGDVFRAKRFIAAHDNRIGFSAAYIVPTRKFKELEPLIDYSFSTFRVEGLPVTSAIPVPTQAPKLGETSLPTLEIKFKGDSLQFDTDRLTVQADSRVTVRLINTSSVNQHNWVLVKPGTKDEVAIAGTAAGPGNDWIPPGDARVIAKTGLLDPDQTVEVRFSSPAPGTYQFTCTFPGHNFTEFGTFVVTPR